MASASGGAGNPLAASKVTFGQASVRTIPGREEVEKFVHPTPRRKEDAFVRSTSLRPVDRKLFVPINRSLGNAEFPVGERLSTYTFQPRTTSRPLIKGAGGREYNSPEYHRGIDELLAKLMAMRGPLHFKSPEGAARVGGEVFESGRLSIPPTMGPGKTVLPEVNYIPTVKDHKEQLADAAAAAEIVRKETEATEVAKIRSERAGAVDGVARLLANEKGGRRSRTRRHKRKRAARQSKRRRQ